MEYSFINDPDLRNRLEKASKFNKGNINSIDIKTDLSKKEIDSSEKSIKKRATKKNAVRIILRLRIAIIPIYYFHS